MKTLAVAYHRVSTDRQGEVGYGLDASRADIDHFLKVYDDYVVAKAFVEIECGDRNNRPELKKAMDYCIMEGQRYVYKFTE